MYLSKNQISDYENLGVIIVRNIFKEWIEPLRVGFQKVLDKPSKYGRENVKKNEGRFFEDYCNWERIIEFKDCIFNSPAAEIVAEATSSRSSQIFHEHIFLKESGTHKETPWHQDMPYYCIEGNNTGSFWIPLDEVNKSSSPEFVLGSNKWNKQFLPTKFFGQSYKQKDGEFEHIPNIENNRKKFKIKSWKISPGDAVVFNFSTVHGAPENKSKNRRRAFSIRFTGDDATYIKRKGEMSPPFPNIKLNNGDPLDSKTFPVLISS